MVTEAEILALKSRISELESQVKYLYEPLAIAYTSDPDAQDAKVIDMLKKGNKLEAIKVYREIHNCGLAKAKRAVDGMESRLGH